MLVAHALAGLVFGVLAALLMLLMGGMQLLPLRTAVVIWALAWPTVLVLGLWSALTGVRKGRSFWATWLVY